MSMDWSRTDETYVLSKSMEVWEDVVTRALDTQHLSDSQRKQFLEVIWRGQTWSPNSMGGLESWFDSEEEFNKCDRNDRQKGYEAFVTSLEFLPCSVLSLSLMGQIFVTDTSSIGIVRECCNIAVGDTAYLLLGGNTPYILRQDSSTPTDRERIQETTERIDQAIKEPLYRLKGPCYLQGYMDGEAMSSFRRGEIDFTPVTLR